MESVRLSEWIRLPLSGEAPSLRRVLPFGGSGTTGERRDYDTPVRKIRFKQ